MGAKQFEFDYWRMSRLRADGRTWPEVAAEFGATEGAAKMWFARRREALESACGELVGERAELYSIAKQVLLRVASGEAQDGDEMVLRAVPVLARLAGLNAPVGLDVRVDGGGAPAVVREYE